MEHEQLEVVVEIEARPAMVWAVLVDPEGWPALTPSIDQVAWVVGHEVAVGNAARVTQPGLGANVWRVTDVVEGSSFSWESTRPGVRTIGTHLLRAMSPTRTTLTLGLTQRGVLAPLLGALLGARTRRYVTQEAEGIRRAAIEASEPA